MKLHDLLETPLTSRTEQDFLRQLKPNWVGVTKRKGIFSRRQEVDRGKRQAIKAIRKHAPEAKKLGAGSFASVYGAKGSRNVVKLTDRNDECALRYLRFAQRNQKNPHILRVHRLEEVQPGFFYARLERLVPFNPLTYKWTKKDLPLLAYLARRDYSEGDEADSTHVPDIVWARALGYKSMLTMPKQYLAKTVDDPKEYRLKQRVKRGLVRKYYGKRHPVVNALQRIQKSSGGKCSMDVGMSHNLMVRPSTGDIVITDPLFDAWA